MKTPTVLGHLEGVVLGAAPSRHGIQHGWYTENVSLLGDLCALVVTLALAWEFDWSAADLVWGLWLSSLTVGFSIMLSQCLHMPLQVAKGAFRERRKFKFGEIVLGILAVLVFNGVVLAFFTLHFGFFHFCHGLILSGILEPDGVEYPGSLWKLPGFAARLLPEYYGVVLASAFVERGLILRPQGLQRVEEPYKGVIKIHLLVLVLLALHGLGATNFAFYAVALLAYFIPWGELKTKQKLLAAPTSERGLEKA